jgi:preprotein translocase subunit SecE
MNERPPSVMKMIGVVAAVVALTILVFFALGYLLGRIFL